MVREGTLGYENAFSVLETAKRPVAVYSENGR